MQRAKRTQFLPVWGSRLCKGRWVGRSVACAAQYAFRRTSVTVSKVAFCALCADVFRMRLRRATSVRCRSALPNGAMGTSGDGRRRSLQTIVGNVAARGPETIFQNFFSVGTTTRAGRPCTRSCAGRRAGMRRTDRSIDRLVTCGVGSARGGTLINARRTRDDHARPDESRFLALKSRNLVHRCRLSVLRKTLDIKGFQCAGAAIHTIESARFHDDAGDAQVACRTPRKPPSISWSFASADRRDGASGVPSACNSTYVKRWPAPITSKNRCAAASAPTAHR